MYVLNWIISVMLIAATLAGGVQVARSVRGDVPPGRVAGCADDARYEAFDFWLGEWVVHTADGALAGHNRITKAEAGCLVMEEWTSAQGGSGRSMNYIDPMDQSWKQLWVDASGTVIELSGGLRDNAMNLEGMVYARNGTPYNLRGIWTPLADGRVRQLFEQSKDGGTSWEPWFDGYYSQEADTTASSQ
jgi:hypothetical protein